MPKNLLLADDSVTVQKMVAIVFAGEDFKITAVGNGEDAVARARELKPDVILADVVMPRKNGYEVCEAIKADPELQRIPVLLLAGTFEAFDAARARAARADRHIEKPFESQALLDKVKELVSSAQGRAPAPAVAAAPARPSQPVVSTPAQAPAFTATAGPHEPIPAADLIPAAALQPTAVPPPAAAPQPRPAPATASARPPAGGLPGGVSLPPGFRPPPAALAAMPRPPRFPPLPAAGQTFPSGLRAPPPPPPPVARPAAPPSPPAAAKPAPAPAPAVPSGRAAWRDPFGLDAPEPRAPAPAEPVAAVAKAPSVPAVVGAPPSARVEAPALPDPSVELDWSDLDVTEEENPEFTALPEAARAAGETAPSVASIDELDFGEGPPTSLEALDLSGLEPEKEFAPLPQEITGRKPAEARPPSPGAGDSGEAQLREALSRASREVIERIAWEVVPQLAETIIREQIDRLAKERQR
jgi:CheY-like chemotaxis protein